MTAMRVHCTVQIDTEDGVERATILGPGKSGDARQRSVRFSDGAVDDWDVEVLTCLATHTLPFSLAFPAPHATAVASGSSSY